MMDAVIFLGFAEVTYMQNMPFGIGPAKINIQLASNDEVAGPPAITKAKLRLVP